MKEREKRLDRRWERDRGGRDERKVRELESEKTMGAGEGRQEREY